MADQGPRPKPAKPVCGKLQRDPQDNGRRECSALHQVAFAIPRSPQTVGHVEEVIPDHLTKGGLVMFGVGQVEHLD